MNFAETLITDSSRLAVTDWAQVDLALRALDGLERSTLLIQGQGRQFAVAGGTQGRYLTWWSDESDQIFDLRMCSATKADEQIALTVGGQEAWFDADALVDLDLALTAACAFVLSGERARGLCWRLRTEPHPVSAD